MKWKNACPWLAIATVSFTLSTGVRAQAVVPPAKPPADEAVKLSAFEVSTSVDKGYGATHTMGSSRINMATENQPSSVITINQQLLLDVGAAYPVDGLQYVSGVNISNEYYGGQITVRGYPVNTLDYRDGLPDRSGDSGGDFVTMSNIERIEVVKGPAGVEFGSSTLGGIINLLTKKPLPYRQTILMGGFESFNTFRSTVDYNDVATRDKRLRVRMIGEFIDGETQYGGPIKRVVVNPMMTYQVNKDTQFWGRFSYEQSKYVVSTSLIADNAGNISFFLPRESLQNTVDKGSGRNVWKYKYEIGYTTAFEAFGTDWSMRMVGRHNRFDYNFPQTQLVTAWLVNAAGVRYRNTDQAGGLFSDPNWVTISIDRNIRTELRSMDVTNFNMDLASEGKIGPANNTFVTYAYSYYRRVDQNRLTYRFVPIDVKNRIQYEKPFERATFLTTTFNQEIVDQGFAWGAQDNIRFINDRLVLVGGSRWDWGKQQTANKLVNPRTIDGGITSAWTFKYGAVGKVRPGLALFYNHSETFEPQVGLLRGTNKPLENLEGESDEVGIKLDLFQGKLSGTFSVFDMALNNFVFLPPGDAQGNLPPGTQEGVNKTKGWEVDFAFRPIEPLSLIVAYGDLTSRDSNGKAQRGVAQGPNYKGLAKYSFLNGPLKGFSFGAGHLYVNKRAAVTGDLFTLAAYKVSNAFATYSIRDWRFQLNVDNVTDEDYATGSSSRTGEVNRSLPRTYKFSVTYTMK